MVSVFRFYYHVLLQIINPPKFMLKRLLMFAVITAAMVPAHAQWTLSNTGVNTFYDLTSVNFPTPSIGYVGGVYAFYKTTNGGSNWTDMLSPIPTAYRSIRGITFLNKDTGFVCGWAGLNSNNAPIQGFILKTTNGGTSWTTVKSSTPGPIYSVKFSTATNGYAAGGSSDGACNLYSTTDGGNTWTVASSFPGLNAEIFDMSMAPNGNIYMCGMLKKGSVDFYEILFKKAAGSSVIDTITFDNPAYCTMYRGIQSISNNETYVVGNKCFNKTTNGGTSWTPSVLNNATSGASFETLYFTSPLVGWAAGDYGDFHNTTDAGANWTKVILPSSPHFTDIFFPNAATGFLVGYGGTIYKYTAPTSVTDPAASLAPLFYPNPAASQIFFENIHSEYAITVTNMAGQVVISQNINGAQSIIDCHNLQAGIYTVNMRSSQRTESFVRKLVITK